MLEQKINTQRTEHIGKVEELKKESRIVKDQLQQAESKSDGLEVRLNERSKQLMSVQENLLKIEAELETKSSLLLASESALVLQREKLTSRASTLESQLEQANLQMKQFQDEMTTKSEKLFYVEAALVDERAVVANTKMKLKEEEDNVAEYHRKVCSNDRPLFTLTIIKLNAHNTELQQALSQHKCLGGI